MYEPAEARELRLIRKRMGLFQYEMAPRLKVSKSLYGKYERGERTLPSPKLEAARALEMENSAHKLGASILAQAEQQPAPQRFQRWIQSCWFLFFVSAVWLITRIAALQAGTDFLRLGPNDEVLALMLFLFLSLSILLANETLRRACFGLPIRNQRIG